MCSLGFLHDGQSNHFRCATGGGSLKVSLDFLFMLTTSFDTARTAELGWQSIRECVQRTRKIQQRSGITLVFCRRNRGTMNSTLLVADLPNKLFDRNRPYKMFKAYCWSYWKIANQFQSVHRHWWNLQLVCCNIRSLRTLRTLTGAIRFRCKLFITFAAACHSPYHRFQKCLTRIKFGLKGAAFLKFRSSGNAFMDANWAAQYLFKDKPSSFSELQWDACNLICQKYHALAAQVLEAKS